MANKTKPEAENNRAAQETWRKPLAVPPRRDAMRAFYQGGEAAGEEKPNQKIETQKAEQIAEKSVSEKATRSTKKMPPTPLEKSLSGTSDSDAPKKQSATSNREVADDTNAEHSKKLTDDDLSERLGIELEDLFDVHELLRGKSFEIYQNLINSCDEKGRCKITQPELMKRTGIKNRRTFYKHEEWLIGLKLLEKRHLPGDHKGVVYRVVKLSDALPISPEVLRKFEERLKNTD